MGAAIPGLGVVALMLVWAVHDGGYDSDTWYWGALVLLSVLAAVLGMRLARPRFSRAGMIALTAFALYVGFSYLSISWAQSPGDALQGSNRALLYLLVFAVLMMLPWTPPAAMAALLAFVLGVGVIAVVILIRLAAAAHVDALIAGGRLVSPTGYFNSTAALFTIDALTATVLATRRELPGLVRGLLIAVAAAGLQLGLIVQSRGWLFTLPLILIIGIALVPDRLRVVAFAVIPAAAGLAPLQRLLHVYQANPGAPLNHAATRAGHAALLLCAASFFVGTLLAWGDSMIKRPPLSPGRRRAIGWLLAITVAAGCLVGGVAATHGHPLRFVERQWHGFSHVQTNSSVSHFSEVGSGRYDFWRVALDAVLANPIGGLGQDNFADYYIRRQRTGQEPSWTHSLEMRLLAHTGFLGALLFLTFLVAALTAALRARRAASSLTRALSAAALMPLLVWLIHGSVDWFWEMPALSGPALGFLGIAAALGERESVPAAAPSWLRRVPPLAPALAGVLALAAAVIALGFPYLSVREVSSAGTISQRNPAAALRALATAAKLDPLSAVPARLAGSLALQAGNFIVAEQRFRQAISREPGGWFAWLGDGLAASSLGDTPRAKRDFQTAALINSEQPVIRTALARVETTHPVTSAEATRMIVLAH